MPLTRSMLEAIAPEGHALDLISGENAELGSGALALAPGSVHALKAKRPLMQPIG